MADRSDHPLLAPVARGLGLSALLAVMAVMGLLAAAALAAAALALPLLLGLSWLRRRTGRRPARVLPA